MRSLFFIAAVACLLAQGVPVRAAGPNGFAADPIPAGTCTTEKEVTDELSNSQRHYILLERDQVLHFELAARNSPYADYIPHMTGVVKIYVIDALVDAASPPDYKVDHVFGIDADHDCVKVYFTFPDEVIQQVMAPEPNWAGHPKAYSIGMQQFKPDGDGVQAVPKPLGPVN